MSQTKHNIRTFELVQYVTDVLEGEFDDWPSNIQDKVMTALEAKAKQVQLTLVLVGAVCQMDYGEAADRSQDRPYVRIIASEVVVKDVGYEKRMLDGAMKNIH